MASTVERLDTHTSFNNLNPVKTHKMQRLILSWANQLSLSSYYVR